MRVFGILIFAALTSNAQDSGPPKDLEISRLQGLADQVKDALEARNIKAANLVSQELGLGVSRREQALHVAELETEVPSGGPDRIFNLARVAKAACEASDYKKAESIARELLSLAEKDPKDPDYGDAIYDGNLVLGRVAWGRDHDIERAKSALLAAGKTPGSPVLGSFGPNMTLAKELLEAGERDTVLQFFEECRSFWRVHSAKLDAWSATIKGCCRLPDFGPNLVY